MEERTTGVRAAVEINERLGNASSKPSVLLESIAVTVAAAWMISAAAAQQVYEYGPCHTRCSRRRQPRPGSGPSVRPLLILSSILKVTFDRDVDQYPSPFTLKPEDHFSLSLGNTVTLDDGAGKSAIFELVTKFPYTWPDPVSIYRNSHPFGVTMHPAAPNTLFTVDAGMNLVWQTNATTGRTKALARFPKPISRT
jgi:hypothetical protein